MIRRRRESNANPLSGAFWRDDKGVGLLGGIAIATSLLAAYVGFNFGNPFVDSATKQEIKTCKTDVAAALAQLRGERAADPNAATKELGWDDQRVQILERCKTLLARIANDLKSGGTSGFTGLGRELADLIPQTLDGFTVSNKCSVEAVNPGTAGLRYAPTVRAHIPFSTGTATLNMTGAVAGASQNFKRFDGFAWSGTFVILESESKNAGGQTSSINVSASAPVLDRNGNPFVPVAGGIPCPEGSSIQPGTGACLITCSASTSFTWKTAPPPTAKLTVTPDTIKKGSTAVLSWETENAASASINNDVGSVATNPTGKAGSFKIVQPDKTTTWTLTAQGVGAHGPASDPATLTVEVPPGEITVSIASPAPNTKTSDFGVDVTGTVSPVPDANHRKAQILVNGAFLTEATIDASGNFAARTALMETLVRDDVVIVGDPNVPVNTCGAKSAPIAVSLLRPQKPLNSIRVIVPLGDGQSAQASVGGIEHVLRVTSFSYTWAGNCGPGSKNESPGRVIAVGDAPVPVGTVDCGFNAPITCTGLVNLAIGTSVGQFTPVQTWNVAIQSCN